MNLMAPDLTAAVMAGRFPSGSLAAIDRAAIEYRRDKRPPRDWPLPPGVPVSRFHPLVGGWPNLIPEVPDGDMPPGARVPSLTAATIIDATREGDRIEDVATRLGVSTSALDKFRGRNRDVARAMDDKRGQYKRPAVVGNEAIIAVVQPGDQLIDVARRAGISTDALRQRRRQDARLNAEIDRRMGW